MTALHNRGSAEVGELATRWPGDPDGLRLVPVPLAPEIRLHLATDAIVLWARMEAEAGSAMAAPYWASAWPGGQALARFVLDRPELVAGRRVMDLAAGSGVAGIAASLAGASSVSASDIDPYAVAAIGENARANGVAVAATCASMLDVDIDADVVLVGDAFYSPPMAETAMTVLERATARGARVLVGDPGRADLPRDRLDVLATYWAPYAAAIGDAELDWLHVLQLKGSRGGATVP